MKENWIAYKTIVHKEVLRFTRIWLQTILPPIITTILYFIIFGTLIGSQIDDIKGVNYMEFLVPGLIMLGVIVQSYSNVVTSFFFAKFTKSIEEILVSPVPNWVIILGFVTGGAIRGLIVGFLIGLVSIFFTNFSIKYYFLTFFIAFLTAVLFSLIGLLNGIYAKKFDDISLVPNFVLTPLTYLGGIFYSISMLPQFWQYLSLLNPILYIINTFRYGMLEITDINIYVSIFMILIFIFTFYFLALYLLNKGVRIKN